MEESNHLVLIAKSEEGFKNLKEISDATKAMIVYQSHADCMVATILCDDGWTGNQSVKIFNAFRKEDYELASQLLKANGWKAENYY